MCLANNKIKSIILKIIYSNIKKAQAKREAENKMTMKSIKKQRWEEKNKYFHLSHVLPGGKALETEGLRDASSVGRGQGPGIGYKG